MPASSSNPQDTFAVITVLVSIAVCLCVVYWRAALRVIIIVAIALAITGAVVVIYGLATLMTSHHG